MRDANACRRSRPAGGSRTWPATPGDRQRTSPREHGWNRFATAALFGFLCVLSLPMATAQEAPPAQVPDVLDWGIVPDAFYFLDKLGSRTMWPDMSFEKLDRMVKADAGFAQPAKPYTFDGISITGTAWEDRAELSITIKLNISPAPGQSIAIPLRMEGFHQTSPADVTGVEEYGMDLSLEQGGYLLWVRADQPRNVEVRMRVVTQVTGDTGSGIDFHLPAASTNVSLAIRGDDLTASVVGRGDEVVRVNPGGPGETQVDLECSGGSFTLQWRERDGRRPSDQVLEVDSRQRVTWDDPQATPSVVVELNVHNRRGSVGPFEVIIPENAELLEPLQNSPNIQLSTRDVQSGRIQVTPDEMEQSSRVKVTIEYRLDAGDYNGEHPLRILPAEVPTAVRQSGEVEIRTDRDYRLRWLRRPNVRSSNNTSANDPADGDVRAYLFQYDRIPFELPVWLAAKQQRLRVEPDYSIRISDTVATLEARITATGTIMEGVPLIVSAPGWRTTSVVDVESGRSLDDSLAGVADQLELELGELVAGADSSVTVRWVAVTPITPDDNRVELPVPTVGSVDDRAIFVSRATLRIASDDGLSVVTNVESSQGLSPLPTDGAEGDADSGAVRFLVEPVNVSPVFRGFLIETPPEATIDSSVEIAAEAAVLRVRHQWDVTPRNGLRGNLPIILPQSVTINDGASATEAPAQWDVSVNGQPAALQWTGEDAMTIYSSELDATPSQVLITTSIPLPDELGRTSAETAVARVAVPVPRPAFDGGTVSGPVRVQVTGSPGLDIAITRDAIDTESGGDYWTAGIIPVRIQSRSSETENRQRIERAVMRSEIGRTRRYDRLVARVGGGGDTIGIDFPAWVRREPDADTALRVYVDGVEVVNPLRTETGLSVPLPATEGDRLVDVRMWRSRDGNLTGGMVRPVFQLPVNSGKTYWDVVLPSDRHLIWTSSGTGELMLWRYHQLFVQRVPTRSFASLMAWVGAPPPPESQGGNRYLLVSSDPGGLRIIEAGRPILWLSVASIVLGASTLLFYLPRLRHPLVGVVAAVFVGGLAWVAPDLAVISGQLFIAAFLLVAVMMGVRAVMTRRPRATVFGSVPDSSSEPSASARRGSTPGEPASTRLHDAVASGSAAGVHS